MPILAEQGEEMCVIHLDSAVTISSAAELKLVILEGLARGQKICFDLRSATELDITVLQLLWAAEREAGITGIEVTISEPVPVSVLEATVNAGLGTFPIGSK
jgi:anti-anti-sigma regulatory factor